MKTQQLLSSSIICVITLGVPFGARANTTAPTDLMLLESGDIAGHRLDRKGDRIDRRLDNKGERINARPKRRGDHRQATRNARRAMGRRGARQSGYAMRGGDNRRVSGKRRR